MDEPIQQRWSIEVTLIAMLGLISGAYTFAMRALMLLDIYLEPSGQVFFFLVIHNWCFSRSDPFSHRHGIMCGDAFERKVGMVVWRYLLGLPVLATDSAIGKCYPHAQSIERGLQQPIWDHYSDFAFDNSRLDMAIHV